MSVSLYIAEKPSVAREFARVLHADGRAADGYLTGPDTIVTWCVGHLVTMSYPEKYDIKYKKWSLGTLPFMPDRYLYEVIPSVEKQFNIVRSLLTRADVERIYVCTDAGREGEYIYRLVEQMCGEDVRKKERFRVWIDSQTEEEILRGVREAKPLSEYDHLSDAAYLRAIEDYMMGINFSRLLTVKYGNLITAYLGGKWTAVSVGRVMTCVLGMVVRREREIRSFIKTPFFKLYGRFGEGPLEAIWHVSPGSLYEGSPKLYRENGFLTREDAERMAASLAEVRPPEGTVTQMTRKTEKKNAPLLYNLAEIQNDASRMFHISPDQTLQIIQELYEKKLVTYPRTDARVLSSAVAKEIGKNISGLVRYENGASFAQEILESGSFKGIGKTRYTNDKLVTDHYAIIPTGQGLSALQSVSGTARGVYDLIVQRFLCIFYPAAEYKKTQMEISMGRELFSASGRVCTKKGYLSVIESMRGKNTAGEQAAAEEKDSIIPDNLRKGDRLPFYGTVIREGETTPPKRYTSGSMILAMENAGSLIEDEELREQIRGSGIGTSATRAEILKKLISIRYLSLNGKTQVITPALLGELVYETVEVSIKPMLNPDLTASWERGLTYVAEGSVTKEEYMQKLEGFVSRRVEAVAPLRNESLLRARYDAVRPWYAAGSAPGKKNAPSGTGKKKRSSASV